MEKHFLNPSSLPNWEQSFSQIVTVRADSIKTIYLSGQVAYDQNNDLIGEGDLKAQAVQAFQNIVKALSAVDATPADVVKLTIYLKNYKPTDAPVISEALQNVFFSPFPVSTWIGVESLALEGLLIEVEVIAVVSITNSDVF